MNRRGFIGMLVGGVAGAAAVRSWPFRVFSFPSDVHLGFGLWRSEADRLMRVDLLDMSLWVRNLTPADVNSADFGLMVMPTIPHELFEFLKNLREQTNREILASIDKLKFTRGYWTADHGFSIPNGSKILDIAAS